jgi:hypothetical protein
VTTGDGGDVTLTVSGDGTTVNADFSGLGNGSCTGVGFSSGPEPITGHSFNYLSPNGQVSASGTFTPSIVSGSAQVLTEPCTTGSQAWRVVGPDVFVDTDVPGDPIGLQVFDPTGADQTQERSAKRGETATFDLSVGNAGTVVQSFSVKGCKSSKGFKVKYSGDSGNVTGDVTAGSFETRNLAPAEIAADVEELELKIKALKDAKPGKTKSCKVTADSGLLIDTVKAKLKVKRG